MRDSDDGSGSSGSDEIKISLPGEGNEEKKKSGESKEGGDSTEEGGGVSEESKEGEGSSSAEETGQQEGDKKGGKEQADDEGKPHKYDSRKESLDSIWKAYKNKSKADKQKTVAKLCDCEEDSSAAVCCAGAREYSSK